jgi:hypothetical protein
MTDEDEAFEDLAKRQGDWGLQGSRKHQIMRYAENNARNEEMTQDKIIEMAQECGLVGMRPHLDGIYIESLLAFAKLVAERALADPMREVQRLGQEIEQEPVAWADHGVVNWIADKQFKHASLLYTTPPQRTWVGLTDEDDIDWKEGGNLKDLVKAIEAKLKEKNT